MARESIAYRCCMLFASFVFITGAFAQSDENIDALVQKIDIPYEKFVLNNGLTLVVHEDRKAPIAAVNMWYHVGSKDEKPGKTGFAHLFEHLMFNGSENFNDDYFQALERLGATDLNGTTNPDRTNYFQNVPVNALDAVLWLESDRMGHMLGAVDQEKLDEQRGVVQNEKRQGENQPYGKVWELIAENTFPKGHPYSWTTIGSLEDLNAASLEDVHEWFEEYYGAANAVICIAGDVNAAEVKEKVEKYFGAIPAGPPLSKQAAWIAKADGPHRMKSYDRVPQAMIVKVWNIPQWGTPEAEYFNLAASVLSSGKTSRLYKRLVYEEQIATQVSAFNYEREIAGQFLIQAMAQPGTDLTEIETAINEELAKFLAEGPTEDELKRVKTDHVASFVRGIERIGGFGGKSDILAMNQVYANDPGYYKVSLKQLENASAKDIQDTCREWLIDNAFTLEVHPYPEYTTIETDVDRSKIPEAENPPDAKFPEFSEKTLDNGLKIVLAERRSIPLISFRLVLDAGYASDKFSSLGIANLAMNMLDEGTEKRSALEISEQLDMLGANLGSGSTLDVSYVSLSTLTTTVDPALEIFADVVLNPAFPERDLERLRRETLAGIQQEKVDPNLMARRVLPNLLYGTDHAYSFPLTGTGTEESVAKISVKDLQKFHQTWFKPNNATLIVVGDITMDEIVPKIEKAFSAWEKGDVPEIEIDEVQPQEKPRVFLIDRPGSIQSVILAGHIAPPQANPDEIAIETMNHILGGSFTSRINMNLREDKHWSYGAGSRFLPARGERPFYVAARVQSDKTKESMIEIQKELAQIVNDLPPTDDEFSKAQANKILELAGSWETIGAVSGSIMNIVQFDLPKDYYTTYPGAIRELTVSSLADISKKVIHPDRLTWVVVGDLSKIEEGIRELEDFGEVKIIDVDGNPIGGE